MYQYTRYYLSYLSKVFFSLHKLLYVLAQMYWTSEMHMYPFPRFQQTISFITAVYTHVYICIHICALQVLVNLIMLDICVKANKNQNGMTECLTVHCILQFYCYS